MTLRLFAVSLVFLAALISPGCLEDAPPAPIRGYEIVETYPHDTGAFTQALLYHEGFLYEGTGLYGRSSLRKVDLETGEVLKMQRFPAQFFGEGLCLWQDRLIQLTWLSGVGFVWDLENFTFLRTFTYPGEGWGLTSDGELLIMSDGTSLLRFLDPETFEEVGAIEVRDRGVPVEKLNELEYVQGEIYANVWKSDRIARISPKSGVVLGWIDLSGLLSEEERGGEDVLNGIAYDSEGDRLFVTGKLWPKLFQIEVSLTKV